MCYQLLFTKKSGKQILLPTIFKDREKAISEANRVMRLNHFAYYDLLVIQPS